MDYVWIVVVFSALMIPGIIGVFLPVIPSIPYMLVIAIIFGYTDKFEHLTLSNLIILIVITIISIIVDYLSGLLGAKFGGATLKSLAFGFLGMTVGVFINPLIGGIIGLFLGILVGETLVYKDHEKALKAATGGLLGVLVGMITNFILAVLFLIFFLVVVI